MFGFCRSKKKVSRTKRWQSKKYARKKRKVIKTKIRGVSFNNVDGTSRQKAVKRCGKGEKLVLKHSPVPNFPNAVAVSRKSGEQLGYISDELSAQVARGLKDKKKVSAEVLGRTGGGIFGNKIRGCNIKITIQR